MKIPMYLKITERKALLIFEVLTFSQILVNLKEMFA